MIVYFQEEQRETLPESTSKIADIKINLNFANNPLCDLENANNNNFQNKDNKMDALAKDSQKAYNLRYKPKRKRLSDIYCTATPECLKNENDLTDELLAKYLQEEEDHGMFNSTIKKNVTHKSVKGSRQKNNFKFKKHCGFSLTRKHFSENSIFDCPSDPIHGSFPVAGFIVVTLYIHFREDQSEQLKNEL